MSCFSSASHLLERVSSPPPSYSTRRPELRISGNCLTMPLSTAAFCTVKPRLGTRNWLRVRQRRIFGDEIGPRRVDRLAMHRNRVRQIPGDHARLAVAVRAAAMLDRDALDAAGEIGRPGHGVGIGGVHLLDDRHFLRR